MGRVVEERAAVRRELDVVQVRRRWPCILRRAEDERLLRFVIIIINGARRGGLREERSRRCFENDTRGARAFSD